VTICVTIGTMWHGNLCDRVCDRQQDHLCDRVCCSLALMCTDYGALLLEHVWNCVTMVTVCVTIYFTLCVTVCALQLGPDGH
jgi:hypothetical protein